MQFYHMPEKEEQNQLKAALNYYLKTKDLQEHYILKRAHNGLFYNAQWIEPKTDSTQTSKSAMSLVSLNDALVKDLVNKGLIEIKLKTETGRIQITGFNPEMVANYVKENSLSNQPEQKSPEDVGSQQESKVQGNSKVDVGFFKSLKDDPFKKEIGPLDLRKAAAKIKGALEHTQEKPLPPKKGW